MSSAPLRISLAGGGTDLPSYARRFGGAVLGASISLRVTVVGRSRPRGTGVRVCLDRYDGGFSGDLESHPFVQEALRRHPASGPLDLVSFSDTPPGSGLGGSAAFSVALLAGLAESPRPAPELAEAGADLEMHGLGRPVGSQDHYLSALGGFQLLHFRTDGQVERTRLSVSDRFRQQLGDELLLFFTGTTRNAGAVLADQNFRTQNHDPAVEERLHEIKRLTPVAVSALLDEDATGLGQVLGRHWELKRGLGPQVSLDSVDRAYRDARAAGATGGKLLGAGGGGYLLVHAEAHRQEAVRAAVAAHGFVEHAFGFSEQGVQLTSIQRGKETAWH